jgi:hypothetical protein
MRTTHAIVALALAMPVLAQTAAQPAAQPAAKTEKLWKIEATGLTG